MFYTWISSIFLCLIILYHFYISCENMLKYFFPCIFFFLTKIIIKIAHSYKFVPFIYILVNYNTITIHPETICSIYFHFLKFLHFKTLIYAGFQEKLYNTSTIGEIIEYSRSTINAYSLFSYNCGSHKLNLWWDPQFM